MANGQLFSSGGSLLGAGLGAGLGAAFGNPILGAKIGGAAGSLVGAAVSNRQAEKAAPPLEDPEQRAQLEEINRRRRAFATGSAFQTERRALGQQQSALSRGIARASRGSTGATLSALARVQRGAGGALNQVFAGARQQQSMLDRMSLDLTNRMAQRRLDLQNLQQSRALAQANRQQREGTAGLQNILASELPIKGQ